MKHIVVHHADCMDGYAAMSLLCMYFTVAHPEDGSATSYALRYDQRDQFVQQYEQDDTDQETTLWVVDFSFTPEQTTVLSQKFTRIVMIDHHDKAIKQWKDTTVHPNVTLYFDNKVSGAMGVRNYIKPRVPTADPGSGALRLAEVAMFHEILDCAGLKLLQDYDLHTERYNETLPFMKYLMSQKYLNNQGYSLRFMDMLHETADMVISHKPVAGGGVMRQHDPMIEIGKLILNYEEGIVAGLVQSAWMGIVCGHSVPVANIPYVFRDMAGTMLNMNYPEAPFSATYADEWDETRQVKIRRWSLRSTKEKGVNLNDIMAKAGVEGGGHPTAAGFVQLIGKTGK